MRALGWVLAAAVLGAGQESLAVKKSKSFCRDLTESGRSYVACEVRLGRDSLQLFWKKADGDPYASFAVLARALEKKKKKLAFAMSAGPVHPDLSPVGLYAENGQVLMPLNTDSGVGNFFTQPNGVVYWDGEKAAIKETAVFKNEKPAYRFATQSGPMLVVHGKLDPELAARTSEKMRNGVGVKDDGRTLVFLISNGPVTFGQFASVFRDQLGCQDALFLNGTVSSLYAPDMKRADLWLPLGPIIGVVQ